MGHRAHNRKPVRHAGELWQVLSDLYSGNGSGNRLEFAPDFRRRGWLHVPDIELTGSAVKDEEHARIGDQLGPPTGVRLQKSWEREPKKAQSPHLQPFPP